MKDNTDAHERMKTASGKTKSDKNPQTSVNKTKTTLKVFAVTTSTNRQNSSKAKSDKLLIICATCKKKHPEMSGGDANRESNFSS